MNYVDGVVAAVSSDRKEEYIRFSKTMSAVFLENGALRVVDCWGDDVPDGETTSLPMAVKCEANETVVFSWLTWPSKEVRDAGWESAMQDERMTHESNPMPFDGKRMIFGGFEVIVDEGRDG